MTSLSAEVLPGRGTVSRLGPVGMWLGTDVPEQLAVRLLQVVQEGREGGPGSIVDHLRALLSAEPPATLGSLAAVAVEGRSVRSLLHGPVVVQNGRGEAHSGLFSGQLLLFDLPMDGVIGIWGAGGWEEARPILPQDLRDGTVPGGGLVMRGDPTAAVEPSPDPAGEAEATPAGVPPAMALDEPVPSSGPDVLPPESTKPVPVVVAAEDLPQRDGGEDGAEDENPPGTEGPGPAQLPSGQVVRLLDLTAPPPAREPLPVAGEERAEDQVIAAPPPPAPVSPGATAGGGPAAAATVVPGRPRADQDEPAGDQEPPPTGATVQGVMCVNGHFNHPDSLYCRVCGIAMVQLTKILVDGPRPSLGVIVVADGSTYTVDREYVLGRQPEPDEGHVIVLKDDRVSRQHARLSASGWDLVVTDLGSSNGTYVKNPGWHDWMRATPDHPLVVEPRGQIGVGGQILAYESSVRPAKV